ncbi:MAG: NAD(P)H-dependent oxidoreductase [Actinomycetota bacterium]|nr:NAD(P)H-dependent oxidoreductase [Actinomycetota bacterium]
MVVVSAGLSQPSSTRLLADRITDSVRDHLLVRDERVDVTVVELRELGQDVMNAMLTGGMRSTRLIETGAAIAAADGVVAVTPVFTASYSGLFKSFFDVLDPGVLVGTPVVVAATAGTERHSMVLDHALRPMFTYLRAVVVPTGVFAATSDFGADGSAVAGGLASRISRAAEELSAQMATPAHHGVEPGRPRAPRHTDALSEAEAAEADGSFTPFEQLLGRPT